MSRRRPLRPDEREDQHQSLGEEYEDELLENSSSDHDGEIETGKHPYYVKEEPANPLALVAVPWHVVMVVFYSLLIYHGTNLLHENKHVYDPKGKIPAFGGRFKYLTHLTHWVQLFFFTIQLFADVSPDSVKRRLQKFADLIFTTVAFPLAALVTITFWGIYAIDRGLIFPEIFDVFVPVYINHFWHTTILLWVVFEIYVLHHHYPSTGVAAASILIYGSMYISWVTYIFVTTDWWCYPFMKVLPPFALALFFSSCLFFSLGLFVVGKLVSYTRWGVITRLEY